MTMDLADYASHDGLGLTALIRAGEISPTELFDTALRAIEAVNPAINAVIETFPECAPARFDANAPFGGVPLLLKDFPIAAGMRAEMGSRLAAGFRPEQDSELMRRLRAAGFATLGRTTTSEFGLMALTVSEMTGVTRNPWDPARSTAGSSGGSAAAVAAGIVPIAQGGDGGGSIRNPAAFCGLVGLKPTRGRVSLAPDNGYLYSGMVVGFGLTRSVRDCAALLDATAGPASGDPFETSLPDETYGSAIDRLPPRLRIRFCGEPWSGLPVDGEVTNALHQTARALESLGHHLDEASPLFDYGRYLDAQITLWVAHTAAAIDDVARALGRRPSADNLESTTLAVYEAGTRVTALELLRAQDVYQSIARDVARFFVPYDVLLTPTNTLLPPLLVESHVNRPGATVRDLFDHLAPIETFTALFNATGLPAISLPLMQSAAGLPIGMQFVSRFGADGLLLQLAAELEQALPWRSRRPRIHVGHPRGCAEVPQP